MTPGALRIVQRDGVPYAELFVGETALTFATSADVRLAAGELSRCTLSIVCPVVDVVVEELEEVVLRLRDGHGEPTGRRLRLRGVSLHIEEEPG